MQYSEAAVLFVGPNSAPMSPNLLSQLSPNLLLQLCRLRRLAPTQITTKEFAAMDHGVILAMCGRSAVAGPNSAPVSPNL